ncbi:hypothetical protein [Actinoplanes sp. NPDC051494]|uniref:hypothetical protein n=1 Tax=Actinoplanes sp. NPDC051494 TaxID=3363907 RepID=UPI0037AC640E
MPTIALLPSALLGPAVWEPVRAELAAAGHDVITASVDGTSVTDVLDGYLASLPAGRDYLLVPHSNAGLYVPGIAARRSVTGLVFVDAILPPATGAVPVAGEGLLGMLSGRADDDGALPVWTSWWPEEDVAALFPSPEARARVSAEQRRLPLTYFQESVTVAPGWDDVPASYLGFGDTYEPERQEAEGRGWRTAVLNGNHLHMLSAPGAVAHAILSTTDLYRYRAS